MTNMQTSLPNSRMYSFLDKRKEFTVHFFEGQKFIHDQILLHHLGGQGLAFFRDFLLSAQHLASFLKADENLGLYVDSPKPRFHFKLETNSMGLARTLLLPEEFSEFPEKISGFSRLVKILPHGKSPYTSVNELKEIPFKAIVPKIFHESYQITAEILLSQKTDQSILIRKLPSLNGPHAGGSGSSGNGEEPESARSALKKYLFQNQINFHDIFEKNLLEEEQIIKAFTDLDFIFLLSYEVRFFCPCSKESMLNNLKSLKNLESLGLFSEGEAEIELRCDYCKKLYILTQEEVLTP